MNNDRFIFRVWDEKRKLYVLPGDLSIDCDGQLWENCTPIDNSDNHLFIEQCTGLKDKNGKLIFEGDVLLFNGSRNPVYFDDGSFVILHSGSVFIPIKQKYTDVFEIIGNIHEMESENEQ